MRGRILRAVSADALGQGLNVGIRILLIPLFLTAWGAEVYGEWLILSAVAGLFGLSDLGAQLYFVNRLTAAWAIDSRKEFQRLLSTGLLLFLLSSSALFICVVVLLMWAPFIPWLELQKINQDAAYLVLVFMAAKLLLLLPVGLFFGVYRALGAQATSVMYANLMLVIQFIASAFALRAGLGVEVLAMLEVIPLLVVLPIVLVGLRRRLPQDVKLFSLKNIDRKILREAISPSFHFLVIQASMAIMIQGSVIVIAKTLGPVEVAMFSAMRTISNVVARFLSMLSHSAWPEFTRLDKTGQKDKLSKLFQLILTLALLAGLVYLVLLNSFGKELYSLWLGDKLPYNPSVMFLLGSFVVVTTLWTLGGHLLMATNQHKEYSRWQLPVNGLALVLCYFGASELGLEGAVFGLILGQSILMIGLVVVLLRSKKWVNNSTSLLRLSGLSVLLLPACLNIWTGLASIAIIIWLIIHQTGFRLKN